MPRNTILRMAAKVSKPCSELKRQAEGRPLMGFALGFMSDGGVSLWPYTGDENGVRGWHRVTSLVTDIGPQMNTDEHG